MSAETKQELTLVELYLKDRKAREAERWTWIAEAFDKAFEEEQ